MTSLPAPAKVRRVLVVDDSAFMRRVIADMIGSTGEFEVIGTGRDGEDAIRQVRALELGAVDFVQKPSGPISLDLASVREQLFGALRAAADAQCRPRISVVPSSRDYVRTTAEQRFATTVGTTTVGMGARALQRDVREPRYLLCIASSTGGPAALSCIVPQLTLPDGAACIVVQHLPPAFTASLAQRLHSVSRAPVVEVSNGMRLLSGVVYIARGGYHIVVEKEGGLHFSLTEEPPLWGVRPAADPLFASVARCFGARTLGVVLTGMGRDGADGLRVIRSAGGIAVVQDPDTSIVSGMPAAALELAGADHVSSLDLMASTIEGALQNLVGRSA